MYICTHSMYRHTCAYMYIHVHVYIYIYIICMYIHLRGYIWTYKANFAVYSPYKLLIKSSKFSVYTSSSITISNQLLRTLTYNNLYLHHLCGWLTKESQNAKIIKVSCKNYFKNYCFLVTLLGQCVNILLIYILIM